MKTTRPLLAALPWPSLAVPFYTSGPRLIIVVVAGRGGMFSLEGPTGRRFLTRSRLFTDAERAALQLQTARKKPIPPKRAAIRAPCRHRGARPA